MQTSEQIDQIAAALAKAQGAMGNAAKDSNNPHFKSKYADLASVRAAVAQPFSDNGLSYVQMLGNVDGQHWISCTTCLMHASGQWISGTFSMPVTKADPQGYGSAATYVRRYSLMAVAGIAPDDDDGNAASAGEPVAPIQTSRAAKRDAWPDGPTKTKTEAMAKIRALKDDGNATHDVDYFDGLMNDHADLFKQFQDARHPWWDGNGGEYESLPEWIERRRAELIAGENSGMGIAAE